MTDVNFQTSADVDAGLKDQVFVFRAMLFGYFPVKGEDFTRVYNPNRGLRVSSIKR